MCSTEKTYQEDVFETKPPRISVVVAVKNARLTIQRCLQSFWKQSYLFKEIVVVDGASNDGTAEYLDSVRSQLDVLVSEPDKGIYDAWNKALTRVSGEWIVFLGADDYLWDVSSLEVVAAHLVNAPSNINVCYGQVTVVAKDGASLAVKGEPWEVFREKFLDGQMFAHQGVFHRQKLFDEHGLFDDHFKIAGDYDLLLRELKEKQARHMRGVNVAGWQVGGISYDVSTALTTAREYLLARRNNSCRAFSGYLVVFYIKAWVLHILTVLFGHENATAIARYYRKFCGEWE